METKAPPIRLAVPSDMSYVLGSWAKASHAHLSSALFLAKQGDPPPPALFRRLFADKQQQILGRAQILIACDSDDPSTILGYAICETNETPRVLHYVQVKRDLMRKGVASALLEYAGIRRDEPCVYTFTSPIQGKVKTPERWVYVPHWLIGDK